MDFRQFSPPRVFEPLTCCIISGLFSYVSVLSLCRTMERYHA